MYNSMVRLRFQSAVQVCTVYSKAHHGILMTDILAQVVCGLLLTALIDLYTH